MSASFPQMAFWVIFPLAALIVLSGWVMILISAAKKLRAGKHREGNDPTSRTSHDALDHPQQSWDPVDMGIPDGSPAVPLA